MEFYKVPAISVTVVNDYEIEWSRAWGVTEPGGNQRVTPDTMFQAASISKAVGAMGVMRLVQDGKLALDANVNNQLRSWKVRDNEFTRSRPVTLRELLSHSAMTSVHGFPGYDLGAPLPTLVQVLDGAEPANSSVVRVEGIPGSGWRYSGGGYEIIQQLVVDTTGESFPAFMRSTVLDPLHMSHSTYEQPLPVSLQSDAAAGALSNGAEVTGKSHIYPEMLAAGLWTTPSDLSRFAIALMNTTRGVTNPVISNATGKLMLTPQIDTGAPSEKDGLGVFLYQDGKAFGHNGANAGFQAYLLAYAGGQAIVVMTNSDNGISLAFEVARAVAREYGLPFPKPETRKVLKVDPAVLGRYVGRYQFSDGGVVSVTEDKGHLYIQRGSTARAELFATVDSQFFSLISPGLLKFQREINGYSTKLIIRTAGNDLAGIRTR
ncbi:MAG: serine hydrolase [Candidatus Binataceae bacterium]